MEKIENLLVSYFLAKVESMSVELENANKEIDRLRNAYSELVREKEMWQSRTMSE